MGGGSKDIVKKDNMRNVVVIFGLPEPHSDKGPIHLQVAEEIAKKLGKGWAFIYTRHLRKIIQDFSREGTNPKEDKLVYELIKTDARMIVKAGFNLIVSGVFAYDRYRSFIGSLHDLDLHIKSYRISGEIPSPDPDLLAIRQFHDKITEDFDVINVDIGVMEQEKINRYIKQAIDFILSDFKFKKSIYGGGD